MSITERTITQICRKCGVLVDAKQTVHYNHGYRIYDLSMCNTCGTVLWEWSQEKGLIHSQFALGSPEAYTPPADPSSEDDGEL